MPRNSDQQIRSLCESIAAVGQTSPIDLVPDGILLNGRHRLIACFMLKIKPEFRTIDPPSSLDHVLADTNQRDYNVAARAWIALQIESLVRKHCKAADDKKFKRLLANRVIEKDLDIELGDRRPLRINKDERLRAAAIRMAGSTPSAVRRLVLVQNKAPELVPKAICGEMNLRDIQDKLDKIKANSKDGQTPRRKNFGSHQQTTDNATDSNRASRPSPSATKTLSTKPSKQKQSSSVGRVAAQTKPEQASKPSEEYLTRPLSNGLTEYHQGDRSAILIAERTDGDSSCWKLLLVTPTTSKFVRHKTQTAAISHLKKFLKSN
ncbi:hypothetical protein NHH03_16665 [Stieleria sp. TO1_6]|uniref:hypothetical protein n=1 Tax=Stieleria tagensis TaxID=2956795 RepID=UPI00209B7582|nr:hypothetical protein [Stieleria tagensis]MCO8123385.1 hypothetical protein [Stieleria tagensis]